MKDAAKAAIDRGDTKYTALDGTPELKKAIAEKFRRENGVGYTLDEVTVATGAKQILFNAFMATVNPGDEVIIPTPYWTSYSDIVEICGGVPVLIPAMRKPASVSRPNSSKRRSRPKPAGCCSTRRRTRPVPPIAKPTTGRCSMCCSGIRMSWLMVDDMYEHIVYDGFKFVTPVAIEPRLKDRTLTIGRMSPRPTR